MNIRILLVGAVVLVASFGGALLILDLLLPVSPQPERPALTALPPLQPLAGTSIVLAPVTVPMAAIRDALERAAPRTLSGRPRNPVSQLLSQAQLDFTVTRGPLNVSGRSDALVITAPLSGTFEARGTVTGAARALGGTLGKLVGDIDRGVGRNVQSLAGKTFDQHADLHGSATAVARPTIAPNWRLAPNLTAQVGIAAVELPVGGVKFSVANEMKPVLDQAAREQTAALDQRLRNDPFIERAARKEWTRLCRAIPLGTAAPGLPKLWFEVRPTRAIAAQPKIDAAAVTLLIGVQAQTRIVPNATTPDCPFPQQLELIQAANEGTLDIAVPIDVPFAEVSRLLQAQFKGKSFPEDGSGAFATTIKQVSIAASGDRLLISLLVDVKKRGFFALGADATVHVWGRPLLDRDRQILRFTDTALDVQSKAAFGLVGEAARAAVPHLERTLADQAVIDLKPFAEDAKRRIVAAVADFAAQDGAVRARVSVDELRLVGIAYDSNTLRVIADAHGTVGVALSSLALQ